MRDLVDSYDTYMALRDLEINIRVDPKTDDIILSPASDVPAIVKWAVKEYRDELLRDLYLHWACQWISKKINTFEKGPPLAYIEPMACRLGETYFEPLKEFKQAVREYAMAYVEGAE